MNALVSLRCAAQCRQRLCIGLNPPTRSPTKLLTKVSDSYKRLEEGTTEALLLVGDFCNCFFQHHAQNGSWASPGINPTKCDTDPLSVSPRGNVRCTNYSDSTQTKDILIFILMREILKQFLTYQNCDRSVREIYFSKTLS
jgi:hypothetical protein